MFEPSNGDLPPGPCLQMGTCLQMQLTATPSARRRMQKTSLLVQTQHMSREHIQLLLAHNGAGGARPIVLDAHMESSLLPAQIAVGALRRLTPELVKSAVDVGVDQNIQARVAPGIR